MNYSKDQLNSLPLYKDISLSGGPPNFYVTAEDLLIIVLVMSDLIVENLVQVQIILA